MYDIGRPTGQRTSGLLFHPTSLPGRYGIGDLGASAYQFVDFLVASGQQSWQVLPLGPPDDVYSPYQGASSMAGKIQKYFTAAVACSACRTVPVSPRHPEASSPPR